MTMFDETLKKIKRGAVEIISEDELVKKLSKNKSLRVKFGVDPTSPDLHLGHTVVLNKLKAFQDLGHKIIFIIGDFTAKIGDPSGRSDMRPMMDEKEILKNAKTYIDQVFKILDRSTTEVMYNSHWLYPLGVDGLLKLTRQTTVSRMLERDDFDKRFKSRQPISILEFIYPLLQGYDSVAINADVELGGTDQIFNLLMGRELQRDSSQEPQVVITMPLLEGTDGAKKMSKTYGNTIALNDTPKDMFGKIMSVSDEMMHRYYELLTSAALPIIKKMHPRDAKAHLAATIVERYYGNETALREKEKFDQVFKNKKIPSEIEEFNLTKKEVVLSDLIYDSGLAASKSEAKRLIQQRAVKIDGHKVSEDKKISPSSDFIVQSGKKNFRKIVITK